MTDERLALNNVKAYYRQLRGVEEFLVKAVDGVTLNIFDDEIVGIVGESGCGKSTLAKAMMMNMIPPLEYFGGRITLTTSDNEVIDLTRIKDRKEIKRRVWGKHIALVPQDALNALMPTIKIKKIAYDILKSNYKGISLKDSLKMAKERLQELDLPERIVNMYPFELSGGMQQRTVLALATLLKPELLIVDEPTSSLDVLTQKVVLKTLLTLKKRKFVRSIVFITHDIATVRQVADRIAVMYAGKILEVADTEMLIRNSLHPYTVGLINSVASIEPEVRARGLSYIPGQPPDLIEPPKGCRFSDRCPKRMEMCDIEEPKLIECKNRLVACWLYSEGGNYEKAASL